MKNVLKQIFEYQRFEKNERLQSLIDDTINRAEGKYRLDDEDIICVNAAGEGKYNGAYEKNI